MSGEPPYEVLEHTADVGLRAFGNSLPELFANSALGMMALAQDPGETVPRQHLPLAAQGNDLEDLLVNWLSEILYHVDAEGWSFCRFDVHTVESNPPSAQGEGWGRQREPGSRSRAVAVKAVTYHQVAVQRRNSGWEAVVYFDI